MKKIKILLITILVLIIPSLILEYINKNISPKLIEYAELEIKKISNLIITESVSIESIEKLSTNEIFTITKNNNEIQTVDFNTVVLNKVIKEATINIQENLKKLESGITYYNNEENKKGIVLTIPLGIIYNNFILNNKGPKIPVKLKILGDMETSVNTKITNYGINSAMLEITLDITVSEKVILPISTKEIKVKSTIPIAIKLINGNVPKYYSGEINKTSTFQIPLE